MASQGDYRHQTNGELSLDSGKLSSLVLQFGREVVRSQLSDGSAI